MVKMFDLFMASVFIFAISLVGGATGALIEHKVLGGKKN